MRHLRPLFPLVLFALILPGCRNPAPAVNTASHDSATAAGTGQDSLLLSTIHVGLPPEGIAIGDLPDPSSQGAVLAARYCGQCHPLPSPAMHSASDWPGVVRRMWLRADRLSEAEAVQRPEIGERVEVLNYLAAHALQVSGATLPPGRGRSEFSAACSRCHALPDPHTHGPQDWPAVVVRMERNMERMKVRPIPPDTIGLIVEYLQGPATMR